ncbi:MAG: MarR family transcriptional regulator [Chloroflexi bacterium]|nr:MarR family transcriptional regulator [Chloroflexota bacterium]
MNDRFDRYSRAPTAAGRGADGSRSSGRPAPAGLPSTAVLAWLRLARVYQKVHQRSTDEMRAHGLSLGQFDILAQVGANDGATQQEVADALLVTKSNVCQLLDRMEIAGLVERRQQGRAKRLYLTAEGRRLYDGVVPSHERYIGELLAALTTDEQAHLLGLLRTLDRALT